MTKIYCNFCGVEKTEQPANKYWLECSNDRCPEHGIEKNPEHESNLNKYL